MVTVRKSKLLTPTSVIPENTYYYEFDCDTIAELPTATYQGTNVAHGSLATIIANGRQYRLNGEGEWCIQRYDASDPILIEKTITENGTYTALDEDVDGYSSVTVNVPSENNAKLGTSPFDAFSPINNIISVDVPIGVTTIGYRGFKSAISLKSIRFSDTVTTIATYAFQNCTKLTSIEIPSNITSIQDKAFDGCTNLESILINKPENSISGAPWGAPNATVTWTG